MLFGKDYTLDTFERWHKEHLALTLQRWTRINVTFTSRLRHFLDATARIQNHYRRILDRRRMAKVEAFIVRAQCMLRATKSREEYVKRRDLHRSVRVCVYVLFRVVFSSSSSTTTRAENKNIHHLIFHITLSLHHEITNRSPRENRYVSCNTHTDTFGCGVSGIARIMT